MSGGSFAAVAPGEFGALLQGEGCHVSSLSWTFSGQKVGEVGEGVEQILGEIRVLIFIQPFAETQIERALGP